jgi:hypothetical protein
MLSNLVILLREGYMGVFESRVGLLIKVFGYKKMERTEGSRKLRNEL